MHYTPSRSQTGIRKNQLAARWGISDRTLDRWEAAGIGPPGRFRIRNVVLYDLDLADRWWAARIAAATGDRKAETAAAPVAA
jgi:hypothetical protein